MAIYESFNNHRYTLATCGEFIFIITLFLKYIFIYLKPRGKCFCYPVNVSGTETLLPINATWDSLSINIIPRTLSNKTGCVEIWASHSLVVLAPIWSQLETMMTSSYGNIFWPFVVGIHWSAVNSPHKGQCHGALMFSLIYAWTNVWVNNREYGDLKRHRAHYDVTVMQNGCKIVIHGDTRTFNKMWSFLGRQFEMHFYESKWLFGIKYHWILLFTGQLATSQHWFQEWIHAEPMASWTKGNPVHWRIYASTGLNRFYANIQIKRQ